MDGGAQSSLAQHGFCPGATVKPKGLGSEFYHSGNIWRELPRMKLSAAACEAPIWMDIGACPDQFLSLPGPPAQWRRKNRRSAAPPGKPLCSYLAGLATQQEDSWWPGQLLALVLAGKPPSLAPSPPLLRARPAS